MGGFLSSHSAVEKTFKKNQEYISEMNKNKVKAFFVIIDFVRLNISMFKINFIDGTLDSNAVSN